GLDVLHLAYSYPTNGSGGYIHAEDYASRASLPLATLLRNGYVSTNDVTGTYPHWALTARGRALLGNLISSRHISPPKFSGRFDESGISTESTVESCSPSETRKANFGFSCQEELHWTLSLGCRNLSGIDATTPLADGEKVDFSWQWKPSELGAADGLTDERQRGAAYLIRKSNGLAVDRIQ